MFQSESGYGALQESFQTENLLRYRYQNPLLHTDDYSMVFQDFYITSMSKPA